MKRELWVVEVCFSDSSAWQPLGPDCARTTEDAAKRLRFKFLAESALSEDGIRVVKYVPATERGER